MATFAEPVNVTGANADTALTGVNLLRIGLIISNDSTAKLYVLIDPTGSGVSSATNFTYVVGAGGTLELPLSGEAGLISTARVRGIWSGVNGSAAVTEVTN